MNNTLSHYGTPRHSGRYPWGSGEDPEQRNKSFLGRIDELKKKGLSEKEVADGFGMTIQQLRSRTTIANAELRKSNVDKALKLKNKGYSNVAIGQEMGVNESTVRSWLNPAIQERSELTNVTANILKESVEKKGFIDVGVGVERFMGVTRTKLKASLEKLKEEGYETHYIPVEQLGTGKKTSILVLAKPGVPYKEVYANKNNIKMVTDYSEDGGRSFLGLEPVKSVDSSRVKIRYGDEGGSDKDGLIELRRGVSDISLGLANYAQVRIGVDGTHYMKGMAVYSNDIPKGYDMIYNTNKKTGTLANDVFKKMKVDKDGNIDPDNPFGATVKQKHYITDKGLKTKGSDQMLELKMSGHSYEQISKIMKVPESLVRESISVKAVNIVNEEGEWRDKWSKSLSSQMLSKQTPALAKKQLGLTYDIKKEEYDEIMSLTNPAVRKRLLDTFSDDCDSAAVHLKAAALPRSGWHAFIPFPTMKENEVYAPNFRDGEKVVIIRYPHGGIFEIPELTVNNRFAPARETIGDQAKDAIGIHPKVAEKLSGADFDGDAGLVIPNNNRSIKYSAALKGLKDFDPKSAYKPYDGMKTIDGGTWSEKENKVIFAEGKRPSSKTKQMKMGDVSNLITDMTIGGANFDELAKAVKHSMVVIDAEKHHLDYVKSFTDNGIAALKKRYQGGERKGASTLISRASSEQRVYDRKLKINTKNMTPKELEDYKSGKKVWQYTNDSYVNSKGKTISRTNSSTKMAEVDDAYKLSSGTLIEATYADHANKLKALANQARKSYIETELTPYSPDAKTKYAAEVASLNAHLHIALKNAPLERQAQVLANSTLAAKRESNPDMEASEVKKIKAQAMNEARLRVGAKKQRIEITDKEWEAIQAGAISSNKLMQILNNTDIDVIKQLATPRGKVSITPAHKAKAEQMFTNGYTQAEVADAIGVSTATLAKAFE